MAIGICEWCKYKIESGKGSGVIYESGGTDAGKPLMEFCSGKCFDAWRDSIRGQLHEGKLCKWYHRDYHECMKATRVMLDAGIDMKGLLGCPADAHYRNNDCLGNLGACHCRRYNEMEELNSRPVRGGELDA